jgi:protein-S-isoprenylcysteine O-methyltransferase Ste14
MMLSLAWQMIYWGWVASEVFIAVATRTKSSGGKERDRGSQLILWTVIVSAITACEWIRHVHHADMFGGADWLRVAALIVMVAGLGIRFTAIAELGKSFSANVAIQDSQKIHRAGLYRFVRHPSYSGLLLVFLAVGLHSRNWVSFAVVLAPTTAALLYRIRVEEAALREAFGDEYLAYSRVTKRLIPGVY